MHSGQDKPPLQSVFVLNFSKIMNEGFPRPTVVRFFVFVNCLRMSPLRFCGEKKYGVGLLPIPVLRLSTSRFGTVLSYNFKVFF